MGGKPRPPRTDREALFELLVPGLAGSAGDELVRPGLTTSPELDRLYACGLPHLAVVDPDHPANRDPRAVAIAAFESELPYVHSWPDRVAAVVTRTKIKARYVDGRPEPLAPLIGSVGDGPMAAGEAAGFARDCFVEHKRGYARGPVSLWHLEAMGDAEAVAGALIDAIESLDDAGLNEFSNHRGMLIWQLGFVLLRVEAAAAAAFRDRLEAVFERARAIYPWTFETPDGSTGGMVARRLDLVLHGSAGAARSGYRISPGKQLDPSSMVFVTGDPDWVAGQLERWPVDDDPEDYTSFWRRPTYLGGERAIALEAGRWRDYPQPERARMKVEMADFASPAVAAMLEEMATT